MTKTTMTTIGAIVALVLTMTGGALAELKIGFVDSERILQESESMKTVRAKLEKVKKEWEQEASDRQKEMQELKEQLEKQDLLLSEERKKEIEDKLKQKYQEYLEWQRKIYQEGWQEKNQEMAQPVIEEVNKILERIAEEEGYDYIFDARAGGVVHAKKGYDLTDKVLVELEQEN